MLSQHIKKPSKEETLFETIYKSVKEKNVKLLTKMVEEGSCLGIFKGEYNPIMLLAEEGDSESVDFLINKFKASRNHAVQGYAQGGHVKQVNGHLEQDGSRDYAVWGYAVRGYVKQVNDQIEQGATRDRALRGYALGGHVEQVDDHLEQGGSRDAAVWGYARGGHVKQVDDLIAQGASRFDAVRGYELGGHVEQANKQQVIQFKIEEAERDVAVKDYALRGYAEQVNALIAQGASRNEAMWGYAFGCHVDQVNKLIAQGGSRDYAVWGYAVGEHVKQVNDQIEQGASRDVAVRNYALVRNVDQVNALIAQGASRNDAMWGYMEGGYPFFKQVDAVLHLMSSTDDEKLRKLLAEGVNKKYIHLDDIDSLLKKSKKINQLIRESGLTYNQAQGYLTIAANVWLSQGLQLVREGQFPAEIYFHILSFVAGCSGSNTKKIFEAANQKIRDLVVSVSSSGGLSLFKSKKFLEESKAAEELLSKRRTF